MMPPFLTTASSLSCPHGGVMIATPGSSRVLAGAPVLRASDTFLIAGCTFAPAGVPHPCVSVTWIQTATRTRHAGDFALTAASSGLCVAGDQAPQGPVQINSTAAMASGL